MDDLPDRMLSGRRRMGLTQDQLAKELGVSQPHLCKVERGDARPSADLRGKAEEWLTRNGVVALDPADRRARELARLIERHSRELVRLVAAGP